MRYFKYDGPTPDLSELRKQYNRADRPLCWVSILRKLGTVVFFLVFIGSFAGIIYLIHLIMPQEEGIFGLILSMLGWICWVSLALPISAIIGCLAAAPLWNVGVKQEKQIQREALQKACDHLRPFYGFREPCLVTKCYRSSDAKWNRHDVCIYIVEDELRITANLQYGFFHPEKDLGCYGLTLQEITMQNGHFRDVPAIELEADGVSFLLSCAARPFIEKQFLERR